MQPLDVTVVIPTHNRPLLVRETVESVLAQTRPPREIIVVDNGTGDETARVLAPYAGRVGYLRMEPLGVQAARNLGIGAATSTWVAILDDDDLYHPTYLEKIALAIEDGRADLVVGDHRKFHTALDSGRVTELTNAEKAPAGYWDGLPGPGTGADWSYIGAFPVERLLRHNIFYPSTMVLTKELLERLGGFDPAVLGIKSEDLEFTSRLLPAARLALVWTALVDYRVHDSNTSGDLTARRVGRWRVYEFIRAKDQHASPALRAALEKDLPKRRRAILSTAFRRGDIDLLNEVAGRMPRRQDWTWDTRVKWALAQLPRPLAEAVLRLVSRAMPGTRRDRQAVQQRWS